MNVLVTGAGGQLGSEIEASTVRIGNYFFTDATTLDITQIGSLHSFVQQNNIDIIVNCAAYTNVDKAEDDVVVAEAINHHAAVHLAAVCKEFHIPLIHIRSR